MQVGPLQPPDRRRLTEVRRASREQACVALDDQVQLSDVLLASPRERSTERANRVVVDADPRGVTGDARGSAREGVGRCVFDVEALRDQRAQSNLEERGPSVRVEWCQDDFLRRP